MEVYDRVRKFREEKGLSTNDLSKLTGISQSTISKLENGKRKADLKILETIAEALNVSVDRFTGESVSSIIGDRLEERGMTLEDLEEISGVSAHWLKNIDNWVPGIDGFGEASKNFEYQWITKAAEALGLPASQLRAAFARQEIPFDQMPPTDITPVEAFDSPDIETILCNTIPVDLDSIIMLPVYGKIAAGIPIRADQELEGYCPLDTRFVSLKGYSQEDFFFLRIQGNSMEPCISHGDLVLVRQQPEVETNEIAVVLYNGEEATVKRVTVAGDKIVLNSDNKDHPPQIYNTADCRILGKVLQRVGNVR